MVIRNLDSDIALARRAVMGEETAFEEIYKNFKSKVLALCLKMCRSMDLAEDLVQIVFMRIFGSIQSYKGEARLGTWIHRLTVNEVLMHFRSLKNKVALDSIDDPEMPVKAPFHWEKQDERLLLESCIKQLPPGYKKIFELKSLGFDHVEIGQFLGISEGTSKSQYHKARQTMRKLINKKSNPRLVEI